LYCYPIYIPSFRDHLEYPAPEPWGNDFFPGRCNSAELGIGRTTEVTRFPEGASPYGCCEMSGNVWEMCEGVWIEDMPLMKGGRRISYSQAKQSTQDSTVMMNATALLRGSAESPAPEFTELLGFPEPREWIIFMPFVVPR